MKDKIVNEKSFWLRLWRLLGVIAVGVLGSAFWDLLKPAFVWTLNHFLSLITGTSEAVSNSIYAHAANDSMELIEIRLFMTLALVVALMADAQHRTSRVAVSEVAAARMQLRIAFFEIALMASFLIGSVTTLLSLEGARDVSLMKRVAAPFLTDLQAKQIDALLAETGTKEQYERAVANYEDIIERGRGAKPIRRLQ